jgi:hypothetical protein
VVSGASGVVRVQAASMVVGWPQRTTVLVVPLAMLTSPPAPTAGVTPTAQNAAVTDTTAMTTMGQVGQSGSVPVGAAALQSARKKKSAGDALKVHLSLALLLTVMAWVVLL